MLEWAHNQNVLFGCTLHRNMKANNSFHDTKDGKGYEKPEFFKRTIKTGRHSSRFTFCLQYLKLPATKSKYCHMFIFKITVSTSLTFLLCLTHYLFYSFSALQDYESALKLDPKNTDLQSDSERIRKIIQGST